MGKANPRGKIVRIRFMYDLPRVFRFKDFTGGFLETNAYALELPGGRVLIDAPEGSDDAFRDEPIALLLLTHGHFDHVADAAKIRRRHDCPVIAHPDTLPMVSDARFFRKFGFDIEIEPVEIDAFVSESETPPAGAEILAGVGIGTGGITMQILDVPGHCPGSLCFHFPAEQFLFGGDVLFRDGIGRWDLPGGSHDLLVSGIRSKILPLPAPTRVFPGHGPETTVGRESAQNPFLQIS